MYTADACVLFDENFEIRYTNTIKRSIIIHFLISNIQETIPTGVVSFYIYMDENPNIFKGGTAVKSHALFRLVIFLL